MLGRQVRTNAWVCSDWGLGEGERGPFGRVWSQAPLSDIFFEGPHDITRYLGF